eukprot:TRINITY_DN1330_c2_g1_i1.p1 TRINITY_DN1330_c2_g1~~TRINITY_DN1330_c2_g1_i1.p1  ORF type:complete len:192 (+),score=68.63 TRINITY_DN1330_c2_g1_i1:340-915(+)
MFSRALKESPVTSSIVTRLSVLSSTSSSSSSSASIVFSSTTSLTNTSSSSASNYFHTSLFSSRDTDILHDDEDLTEISGIPKHFFEERTVRVYQPAPVAMQSGRAKYQKWKLDFGNTKKWVNPLMGWTSGADPFQQLFQLSFETAEEAKEYLQRQGWQKFYVDEAHIAKSKPKNYADNFKFKGKPGDKSFF